MGTAHLVSVLSNALIWVFMVMNAVFLALFARDRVAGRVWLRVGYGVWCLVFFGVFFLLDSPVGIIARVIELVGISAGWLMLSSAYRARSGGDEAGNTPPNVGSRGVRSP